MSILSEPRKPDCDVCDWATAYHYAYGLNLCGADLDIANKIAEAERERIIKLLEARFLTNPQPNMENDTLGSFSHAMHNQMIRNMVALIKGENK